jgi:hypothetical protein
MKGFTCILCILLFKHLQRSGDKVDSDATAESDRTEKFRVWERINIQDGASGDKF